MTVTDHDVELHGLTRRYGRIVALDHVDFAAGPGVTGLLGPNGAGKTTLLRIIATVLGYDTGTLSILGRRTPWSSEDRHAIRTRLGYQPQEPGFFQGFTVRAFLDYVAILKEIDDRGTRRREVGRVIELVGLGEEAGRKIRRLSGGMRRRVAIAQALLGRPQLLILDEPTAGLDPEQRMRFREVVSTVATEATVLLSTHQTDDVSALCDRVAVLHRGQVRFAGTPGALAELAAGQVWLTDHPGTDATTSWRTGTGEHRVVGAPSPGARPVPPTVDDGYMILVAQDRYRLEASP
jgi:ABC-2 type transport system ATP-binding protein